MHVNAVVDMHISMQAVVIILQITVSTQGKSIEDIRPWILGAEGSNVTLAIRRGGNQLSGALLPRMLRHVLNYCFLSFLANRQSNGSVQCHASTKGCGSGSISGSKAAVSGAARACLVR